MAKTKSTFSELGKIQIDDIQYEGLIKVRRAKEHCNDDIHFLKSIARDLVAHPPKDYSVLKDETDFLIACSKFVSTKVNRMNAEHAKGNDPTEQEIRELQSVISTELEIMRVILREREQGLFPTYGSGPTRGLLNFKHMWYNIFSVIERGDTMVTDNSTLKEIEERTEEIKKEFLTFIKEHAKDKRQFSALKNNPRLEKMNRELCVLRCEVDEKSSPEKDRIINEIMKVDKAIFSILQCHEPTSTSKQIPD